MEHRVALAYASSLAAEAILEKLPESGLPPDSLILLDDESRHGGRLSYGKGYLSVHDQRRFDYSECALLLLPQRDDELERIALGEGSVVAGHALDVDTPAVFVGEDGRQPDLRFGESRVRLAGPEICCLAPALSALQALGRLEQINTVLLRSAEFHGKAGVDELAAQTVNLLNAREASASIFPQQIAFNLLSESGDPHFVSDLGRILGNNSFPITQQTVNVPVFHGFAAAIQLRYDAKVSLKECESLLLSLAGMEIKHSMASPIADCNQSFNCVVSQLEQDPDQPASIRFWMIADPLRYGLANNYVNVTDFLLKSFL
jgi:aspartate-semialdehyde dehydrogenase